MAFATQFVIGAALLLLAVFLGYQAYQYFGQAVGLWADLGQLAGGVLYFIIFSLLLFLGGPWRIAAFVMVIFATAIILRKQDDARQRDLRTALKGGGD
jgi:hypothetical protein